MTSTSENEQKAHFELEDALQAYPIISAPENYSESVMNSILTPLPKPQFRLSWIDYALSFFCTSMNGLILLLWQRIPTQWVMNMRFQAFVLWERSTRISSFHILLIGFALVFIVIFFQKLFFRRPGWITASQ